MLLHTPKVTAASVGLLHASFSVCALAFALLAATAAAGQVRSKDEVRLLFTGDIMMSRQVGAELKTRISSPWAGFQRLFLSADWVGGNFEGAIGQPQDCLRADRICLATPAPAAQTLARAGFHAVTIENNHSGDLGSGGRERTRKAFEQAALSPVYFDNSPEFFVINKTEIALIAVTTIPAADGRQQRIPSVELSEKLRLAKSRASVVIVSIHWGNELMEWPSTTQRKQAAWLIDNGADLVLGHHPHVIQRPECIEGKPVFFALGNHVFDQANPKTKEGMIADCRIRLGRLHCQALRTHAKRGSTIPVLDSPDGVSNTLAGCAPNITMNSTH